MEYIANSQLPCIAKQKLKTKQNKRHDENKKNSFKTALHFHNNITSHCMFHVSPYRSNRNVVQDKHVFLSKSNHINGSYSTPGTHQMDYVLSTSAINISHQCWVNYIIKFKLQYDLKQFKVVVIILIVLMVYDKWHVMSSSFVMIPSKPENAVKTVALSVIRKATMFLWRHMQIIGPSCFEHCIFCFLLANDTFGYSHING